jgi:hypothetical protein
MLRYKREKYDKGYAGESKIGEMKSYSSFSRSPRFTAFVSISRVFGDFAEKPQIC